MKALIELAVLVLGVPYLFQLYTGRRTIRVRFVQQRLPSATVVICVVLGVIVFAALRT